MKNDTKPKKIVRGMFGVGLVCIFAAAFAFIFYGAYCDFGEAGVWGLVAILSTVLCVGWAMYWAFGLGDPWA